MAFSPKLGLQQILPKAPVNDLEEEVYIENFAFVNKSFLNGKVPVK